METTTKTKLNLLFFFFLLSSFYANAQYKGEIDPNSLELANELAEKHEKTSVISLRSSETITFGWDKSINNVYAKHTSSDKLLALDISTFYKTNYYNDASTIKSTKVTYKNGVEVDEDIIKPVFENYKQSGIFHSDAKICYLGMKVFKGYRYNVEMTKHYNDLKYLTSVYFHESYPIQKKTLKFKIPTWMEVELKEMNFEGFDIEKKSEFDEDSDMQVITYTFKNLPKMSRESRTPGPSHVYPHLLVLSKSYTQDGKTTNLFKSTDDLYGWYKTLVKQMENDPQPLTAKVNEITASASTDLEKISSIYYWVQDNVRYIAFEDGIAGFQPENCQAVFDKKYGDCKGMANLTKQMLKAAGYDARLVWLGTSRLAYDYSTPSLAVDNHMICAVMLNGEIYYLDATEKYGALGEYADRIQGRPVMIEDGESYLLKTIPAVELETNVNQTKLSLSLDGEQLTGKAKLILKGESKSSLLYGLSSIETDNQEKALKAYLNDSDHNFVINELKVPNLENRDDDIQLDYNVVLKNKVSSFDNEIYIDLDISKEFENFQMEDDRESSYQFSHKMLIDTQIEMVIPEGYQVSYLPEKLEIDQDGYVFSIQYEQKNGKLVYTKKLMLKSTTLPKSDFSTWNKSISQLEEFYTEQVILTK